MYRTIVLSDFISIQGEVVEKADDGQISVSDGQRTCRGWPLDVANDGFVPVSGVAEGGGQTGS